MNLILFMLFTNLFRGHFVKTRDKFNLQELVQIHHIIPREWKNHKNIKNYNYNINAGYNLIFMPNKYGITKLNTKRKIHDGGHPDYNLYVLSKLNQIEDPFQLSKELRFNLTNNVDIPW
tara:strand:+ start:51 stop:407 length:357 start_codon:yes stop_codon:yes gene_type:complete